MGEKEMRHLFPIISICSSWLVQRVSRLFKCIVLVLFLCFVCMSDIDRDRLSKSP